MIEKNYVQATRLINLAEAVSKLPVRVTWDDSLQVGAILHLSEADWAKQIRISVNPNRPDIPYLVATQCALVVRFFKQNENKHLVANNDTIKQTITQFIDLGYVEKEAEIYAQHLVSGIGQQLRGMPAQILISAWIYREYPELRESQLLHLTMEVESSYPCLDMSKNKFPAWLLESHQAMNGSFALASDYLYGRNDLFEPFKMKGFEEICIGLVSDITNSCVDTSDTQLVSLWLDRLGLNNIFEWHIL
jgi:hypothetical protein